MTGAEEWMNTRAWRGEVMEVLIEGYKCAHGREPLDHARAHGSVRREQGKEFCGPTLAGMRAKRREIGGRGFFRRGVLAGLPEFCGVFGSFAEFPRACGSAITRGLSPLCAHRKSGDFGVAFGRASVLRINAGRAGGRGTRGETREGGWGRRGKRAGKEGAVGFIHDE